MGLSSFLERHGGRLIERVYIKTQRTYSRHRRWQGQFPRPSRPIGNEEFSALVRAFPVATPLPLRRHCCRGRGQNPRPAQSP